MSDAIFEEEVHHQQHRERERDNNFIHFPNKQDFIALSKIAAEDIVGEKLHKMSPHFD